MFAENLSDNHYCPLYPTMSFRKAEQTAKGTLLVSSLIRNLFYNPLIDYGQQSSQRSPFRIACSD